MRDIHKIREKGQRKEMCFSAEESFLNMELDEKESAKH